MFKRFGFVLLLTLALLPSSGAGAVAAEAASAQNYTIVDLGTLPGFAQSSATGINDRGQIVGYSYTPSDTFPYESSHAVLWDGGRIADLGILPGARYDFSSAAGINNRGQIVGYSSASAIGVGFQRAVVWDNGQITDLGI